MKIRPRYGTLYSHNVHWQWIKLYIYTIKPGTVITMRKEFTDTMKFSINNLSTKKQTIHRKERRFKENHFSMIQDHSKPLQIKRFYMTSSYFSSD